MSRSSRAYTITIFCILLGAFILRFVNYTNRWALASDQGRDALMGRYIMTTGSIPLVGPFSQAGSVVMGPTWYLMIAGATLLQPSQLITPWFVLTLSFVLTVFIMIKIGEELDSGAFLPAILGVITAVSPSEIRQSVDLTNPSAISVLAAIATYCTIRYIKSRTTSFAFLFPFFVSLAAHTHLQAAGLIWIIPVAFIVRKPTLKHLLFGAAGFLTPFATLLPFELLSGFYDTRNFLLYIFVDQYKVFSSTRWLTYAGSFWPGAWGRIVGGYPVYGYLMIFLTGLTALILGISKKLTRPVIFILATLFLIILQLRYFRGSIFDGYLIFTHPFVIVITGWVIRNLSGIHKTLPVLIVVLLSATGIYSIHKEVLYGKNITAQEVQLWSDLLISTYPEDTFAVYDYTHKFTSKTYPLTLYLYTRGKASKNGRKIGLAVEVPGKTATLSAYFPAISGKLGGYQLFDLSASTSADLGEMEWHNMSPEVLYDNSQNFYKK